MAGISKVNSKVQEASVTNYTLQKNIDGVQFHTVGSIGSKGDGTNNYQLQDGEGVLTGTAYYRILMTDKDGTKTYSEVIKLEAITNNMITIYPTIFSNSFTVKTAKAVTGYLTDAVGKIIEKVQLAEGLNTVVPAAIAKGIYILKLNDGQSFRLVKQ